MRARMTASFGVPYNYSGMTYPQAPWADDLARVRERLVQHLGHPLTNCLANLYPDGSSTMGFHSDNEEEIEPTSQIAIVSLGAARTLTFRRTAQRDLQVGFRLEPGSLLTMGKELQKAWQHGIGPEAGAGPRISLTFRYLR